MSHCATAVAVVLLKKNMHVVLRLIRLRRYILSLNLFNRVSFTRLIFVVLTSKCILTY